MTFNYHTWSIQKLIDLYNAKELNLNPEYQRNDIWPPISKRKLIESIKIGYPIPTFFLSTKDGKNYEMVDGQQRTRTFLGYQKGFFGDMNKKLYSDADTILYNEYKISICILNISNGEEQLIEDFYYRVNKYGIKLNRPEMKKAGFANTSFQLLINKLSAEQSFIQLALFSEKTLERLNDLDFISELLTLCYFGITDKKIAVDKIYENQEPVDFDSMEKKYNNVIQKISDLDSSYPLSKTRYKQRNDFYTLFSFILKHDNISDDLLFYQYKILILIGDDIFPTNDKCWSFQEYANNCVSQSNSKKAREERLKFFEKLLLNTEENPLSKNNENEDSDVEAISDTIKFYRIEDYPLKKIENYFLIDIDKLKPIKSQIII